MPSPRFLPAAVLAAAVAFAPIARGQAPSIEAVPTATPPKIDGVLSPGEWAGAAHSDAFRQVTPEENVAPSERTEFWVTYDPHYIYVAVRNHDGAGRAGIRAYSMQKDQNNGSDDIVRVVIDPFHRAKDGYYFALTAPGGKHDGLIQNSEEANDQWDALWHGKTSIDDGGWTAEFAIPAKTIAFNPSNSTWGFNVARAVRRKQEAMRWAGFVRSKPTIALPLLGELHGVTGLQQGRGLDFRPYLTGIARHHPRPDEKNAELRTGFDLIWHITPSLAATATLNTDFADAEVDERQVNLGRFSLFFPEKRAFFTQDAPLFTFAGIRQDPLPFFSRRIGLADDGTKVDVLGGLKLTGRVGRMTLGLLDVQIDEHAGVGSKNLAVARATFGVLEESNAGFIVTHGDPRTNGDATLLGADFNYENNRLGGNRNLHVRAAVQYTDTDLAGDDGAAGTFSISYPGEPFEFYWFFSRIGTDFDPALGFVPRTGIQNVHLWNRYRWYFQDKPIRRLDFFLEGDLVTDLHNRRLDQTGWVGFEGETPSGDFLNLQYQHHRERLDAPFAIRPGIVIPRGDHGWGLVQFVYDTNRSRPWNVGAQFRSSDFFTGHRTDYELELGARPSRFLELAAAWRLRSIRLPQGGFDVRIGTAKAVVTFSPDVQASVYAQYDNFSDTLGVNARLKWIVQPGNEVFFIVNQGYDATSDSIRPTANETSLKAAWTLRF
jgi:hypothetical protein